MFSRDNLTRTIKKPKILKESVNSFNPECGIINLDDTIGSGTHWVCYYDNYYFDPFGMPPPVEVVK